MGTYTAVDGAGKLVTFGIKGNTPSTTEQERIRSWLAKSTPAAAAPAEGEGPTGFFPALESGFHGAVGAGYGALQGIGSLIDSPDLQKWSAEGAALENQRAAEALPNPMTLDKIGGIGDILQFGAEAIGQSVPYTVGAAAGALAAGAALPASPVIAGIAGGAAVTLPFLFGSNINRQVEEGEEVSPGAAFAAAVPQALAESVVTRFTLGLGKWGKSVPTKALKAKVTRTLTHVAESAGAEGLTESAQQMLERLQAGLPIDNDEAFAEYANAAAAGAIAGGAFGVFGGGNRERKSNEPPPPQPNPFLQKNALPPGIAGLLPYYPDVISLGEQGGPPNGGGGAPTTGRVRVGGGGPSDNVPPNQVFPSPGREFSSPFPRPKPQPPIIQPRAPERKKYFDNSPQPIKESEAEWRGRVGKTILPAEKPPAPSKAEVKKAEKEASNAFTEEHYKAALDVANTTGQATWVNIRRATGLPPGPSKAIREEMIKRGDVKEVKGKLVPTKPVAPIPAAPKANVIEHAIEPVVNKPQDQEAQPAVAVVQKEVAPSGEVVSSTPIEVVKPEEAPQALAAARAAVAAEEEQKSSKAYNKGKVYRAPKAEPFSKQRVSLFQFIASQGGMQEQNGELKAMGVLDKAVVFPGMGGGKIFNPRGKSHDYMREAVAEAGYFDHMYASRADAMHETTVADLLELMSEEAGGNLIYPGDDQEAVEASNREAAYRVEHERGLKEIQEIVDRHRFENIDPNDVMAVFAKNGGDLEDAVLDVAETNAKKEAAKEDLEKDKALLAGKKEPGVTIPTTTSDQSKARVKAIVKTTGKVYYVDDTIGRVKRHGLKTGVVFYRPGDLILSEINDENAIPGWDIGPDNKPQAVLPGAEALTNEQLADKKAADAMAARQSQTKMEPAKPQKGVADIGIFSDAHKQADLVEAVKRDSEDDMEIPSFLKRSAAGIGSMEPGAESIARLQNAQIGKLIWKHIGKYFPPGIGLAFENYLNAPTTVNDPTLISHAEYDSVRKLISIAGEGLDPNLSNEEFASRVAGLIDHEIIHALRDTGLFTADEWATIAKFASNHNHPQIKDFIDKYNPEWREEEAVAQLFRLWRGGDIKLAGAPRTVLQKIINFFKRLVGFTTEPQVRKILERIASGEVSNRTPSLAEQNKIRRNANESTNPSTVRDSSNGNSSSRAAATAASAGPRVPATPANIAQNITYTEVQKRAEKWFGKAAAKAGIKDFGRKTESVIEYLQDKMISLGALVDRIRANGGTITDATDPYLLDQLRSSQAGDKIKANARTGGIYKKAADGIGAIGFTAQDRQDLGNFNPTAERFLASATYKDVNNNLPLIDLYLYAKAAPERNARLSNPTVGPWGSGMSDFDANEIRGWFERHPRFANVVRAETLIRDIIRDTNAIRVANGLIPTGLEGEQWYVPLRGFLDEDIDPDESNDDWARSGQGLQTRYAEDRKPLGRGTLSANIFNRIMLQNEEAVIRGGKANVGQSFVRMILDNEEILGGLAEIIRDPPVKRVRIGSNIRLMVDPLYKDDPNVYTTKITQDLADRLGRKLKAGDEVSVRIHNDRLAAAMKGGLVNEDAQRGLIRLMSWVNKKLTAVNTTFNPAFFLPNFFRDLMTASVNIKQYEDLGGTTGLSKDLMGNIRRSFTAMRRFHREGRGADPEFDRLREEMAKAGGFTEFYGLRSLEEVVKRTNSLLSEDLSGGSPSALKQSWKAMKGIKNFIEAYNSTFEDTTRLAVYKTLRDKGFSIERAAQAAKGMTVNFQQAGSGKMLLNSMYLFYNASIQGTWAIMNAGLRSRKVRRAMSGIVAAGVMQDIIMSMLSPEDDDGELVYDKIPQWQLEHNMIFLDPLGLSDRGYFMIPLPYGFNSFFNAGRAAAKLATGRASIGDTIGSTVGAAVDAFNPVGGSGSWVNTVAPTLADPFVDIISNRDFADRPIVPERGGFGVETPASQLYWNNTSPLYTEPAKWLSQISGGIGKIPGNVEISPEHLQYGLEYILGGLGSFVRQSFGVGMAGIETAVYGSWPDDVSTSDIPMARRLYGNISARNDLEQFVKGRDELLAVEASVRQAFEVGDAATAMEVINRYPDEYRMSFAIKKLNSQRAKLGEQIRMIERNPNIPADKKRESIDALKEQQDKLVGIANRLMADL